MSLKKRSAFVEWGVYTFALISITGLVYLFSTRSTTTMIVEDAPLQKVISVAKNNINSVDVQIDKTRVIEKNNDSLLIEDIVTIDSKKSRTIKKSYKDKNNILSSKRKNKSKDISSKKSHRLKKKNITGFTAYKKPILVKYKNYNFEVLSRFPEQPNKTLYKIGFYKVRLKDTMYSIADKFKNVPINLIAINKQIHNPDKLEVGTIILIANH